MKLNLHQSIITKYIFSDNFYFSSIQFDHPLPKVGEDIFAWYISLNRNEDTKRKELIQEADKCTCFRLLYQKLHIICKIYIILTPISPSFRKFEAGVRGHTTSLRYLQSLLTNTHKSNFQNKFEKHKVPQAKQTTFIIL